MMKTILTIMTALFLTSCAGSQKTDYYKGYELPPYTVSESHGAIELRRYRSQLVAEVTVDGTRDEAVRKGFRILANYIFGDNVPEQKVTMTTPVAQKPAKEEIAMTTPVFQSPEGNRWVIQFGMPKAYTLSTLPKAKDERIHFHMTEPKYIVAIRFSGRWNDVVFKENKEKIEQFIATRKLTPLSPPAFAYYDDPFTLPWNRRNEVLVEVKE
jgi:SOUL heme-binding protein